MKSYPMQCSRRAMLRMGLSLAVGAPLISCSQSEPVTQVAQKGELIAATPSRIDIGKAKVAVVRCKTYGKEVYDAYKSSFDLIGGIGSMVKGKTVAVKVNLTGHRQQPLWGRPAGETYVTHDSTVKALCAILFEEGAQRVRIVESAPSAQTLEDFAIEQMDWDVPGILAMGNIEFENTRNMGTGKDYCTLKTPSGGFIYEKFMLNHSYEDADVYISLAKLKNHATAGVTLTLKNMFGTTPNAIYGDDAGSEEATKGRGSRMHWSILKSGSIPSFGEKADYAEKDHHYRIPAIVADVCSARPVDISILDGITSMSGGEGPWCRNVQKTEPGVLIVGLNPVSTDAVGTAVMGYPNPLVEHYSEPPFDFCVNHLLLAQQAGVGTADLSQIDVRGESIQDVIYPYPGAKV